MPKKNYKFVITKQTRALYEELNKRGVQGKLEYWDGHKHIDIAILEAGIFIEIDGMQHFMDPKEIERDFKRNHYSEGDDFNTIHIPNIVIDNYLERVADAVAKVAKSRKKRK